MDQLTAAQVDAFVQQGYTLLHYRGRLGDLPSIQAAAMREYASHPGQYLIKNMAVIGPFEIIVDEDELIQMLEKLIVLLRRYKEQKHG